jgi:Family of unknown function (DUF6325)
MRETRSGWSLDGAVTAVAHRGDHWTRGPFMALDVNTIGPVEYTLFEFPGSKFNGDVAPALAEAARSGVIRIIDLVLVKKAADGSLEVVEVTSFPPEVTAQFDEIDGEIDGLFNEEDIATVAQDLEPGSSGLLILWEAAWAARLAAAVRGSGGELVARETVPRDLVEAAVLAMAN